RRHADQLLQIIDDLLDISKLETGKLTLERCDCSPRDLALEVTSLLQVRAEEKKLRLAVEFHSALPPTIESDRMRLRPILLNLGGNAVKFTEVGEVRLMVRMVPVDAEAGPRVEFDVIDTGVGMTSDQLRNIFDCFSQGDMSAKRRFRGIGLGLAIAARLAK